MEVKRWKIRYCSDRGKDGAPFEFCINGNDVSLTADFQIYYTGHIFPVLGDPAFSKLETSLMELFHKYDTELTSHIKGFFNLIFICKKTFYVFGDHFGILKFFHWSQGSDFILSNELQEVVKYAQPGISAENLVVHNILNHFTGGITCFSGVYFNQPASMITFKVGLVHSQYWDPFSLYYQPEKKIPISELAGVLAKVLGTIIDHSSARDISLTLTGGNDSRILLAVLMADKQIPYVFTYGDKRSIDAILARKIALSLNLKHEVYDTVFTEETFESMAKEIIREGNTLSSPHRAHRYATVCQVSNEHDFLLLGSLGGEMIKVEKISENIVPGFIKQWPKSSNKQGLLESVLTNHGIRTENIDIEYLLKTFHYEPMLFSDKKLSMFALVFNFIAHIHVAQDINLFLKHIFTYLPFLDIDYLKILFSSQYTFKSKYAAWPAMLGRFENPLFASLMISHIFPDLINIPYSNRYSSQEYLKNKYWASIKKTCRGHFGMKYPQNFPLGDWMSRFVEKNLERAFEYDIIRKVFQPDAVLDLFKKGSYATTESYWLRFTHILTYMFILEEFS